MAKGKPDEKLERKVYEKALKKLHVELVNLQEWVKLKGLKICIIFEGRDGAGKGGVIKAITERVSPRVFRVVALPTGRILFELARVCERLDVFDAVVAENGAVLYFPADSAVRDEGPAPSMRLLWALDRRQVPFRGGRVIVATTHDHRDAVLGALAEAEVALKLVENRGALMLLPAGISKGTGLMIALFGLGVSAADVLAIGDAENDFDLLDACGWSACPENALPQVKARVDWILPGADGEGVRRAIDEQILENNLPPPRTGRQQIYLG